MYEEDKCKLTVGRVTLQMFDRVIVQVVSLDSSYCCLVTMLLALNILISNTAVYNSYTTSGVGSHELAHFVICLV